MTTENPTAAPPKVTPADRSRARKVLAMATDETSIGPERTAAWLRLTGYAEAAGMPLEAFLAAHVLPGLAGGTLDQMRAEAERLAGIAGEAIGDREVAMLRAEVGMKDALTVAGRTRRGRG